MSKGEKKEKLLSLLSAAGAPARTRKQLATIIGCDVRTVARYIEDLRNESGIDIRYDKGSGKYDVPSDAHRRLVRGLYFNPAELNALLVVYHMLQTLDGGLLDKTLAPLEKQVVQQLSRFGDSIGDINKRLRVVAIRRRPVPTDTFTECARATLQRKRISMRYESRSSGSVASDRVVSPQHLLRYRDNWYLVAHCHKRKSLLHFSLDAILDIEVTDEAAVECDERELHEVLESGYGIFSGKSVQTAVIRFNAFRAHWLSQEIWHPKQTGRLLEDGSWEMRLPYANDTELISSVLEYGDDAEILEPLELREKFRQKLKASLGVYEKLVAPETGGCISHQRLDRS